MNCQQRKLLLPFCARSRSIVLGLQSPSHDSGRLILIVVHDIFARRALARIRRERVTVAAERPEYNQRVDIELRPEVRIAAVAYADDLTLAGTSWEDLQATMDLAVTWSDMVGVQVNTTKTELLEWPRPDPSEPPLTWRQGEANQPITRSLGDSEPARLLGQYIVPDGKQGSLTEFIRGTARTLTANLGKKWITDRQAQYMYQAVLCPALAYKMQGVVLSEEEITAIQAPLMTMVKHKFGVPSTTPESFWFARSGGRLTRLHAEYDRRGIEMTVRMRNGEGCTECRNLAKWIEAAASKRLKFPGDPLAYPELAEATVSRITGESWWPNVTLILARRGINIGIPATGEVQQQGPKLFWECKMKTQINVLNRTHVGTAQPPMIKGEVARKVLEWPATMPEPTAELFLADEIKRRFRRLDIAGLAASATRIEIHTNGSLEPGSRSTPARMGFAAIFWFHMAGETIKEVTVAGATKDGPFSSTMAEIMAIVAVLAVLPSDVKATVWWDSQAAIAYTRLLQKKSDNSWRKSPQAYMAQFHIDRIRQRREPLRMKWVRGHKGNKGNEATDCVAKDAWSQPQGWWSLRLGSLPERPSGHDSSALQDRRHYQKAGGSKGGTATLDVTYER
ncbi:hypothetical protein GGI19_004719 [Coemansia pectinata]|uniref:RNase H type-1 domain-containing protein n=1 Tax=Coemansia pectinata TaxID=1052879 RepID=A0A9W8GS83_9FUNG|nr:hypothetical protein GGI19_004719 [Coemansia pectinata]